MSAHHCNEKALTGVDLLHGDIHRGEVKHKEDDKGGIPKQTVQQNCNESGVRRLMVVLTSKEGCGS